MSENIEGLRQEVKPYNIRTTIMLSKVPIEDWLSSSPRRWWRTC
ncbi:MAG: hypothetical protein ACYC4U_08715 [Pirellulaceae bacterium]